MSVLLTKDDVFDGACKAGEGAATCRYLAFGLPPGRSGRPSFQCAKHQPDLSAAIDSRCEQGLMKAMGDNCEGRKP